MRRCVSARAFVCVDVADAPGRGYHHGNWIEAVSAPERLQLIFILFIYLFSRTHRRTRGRTLLIHTL